LAGVVEKDVVSLKINPDCVRDVMLFLENNLFVIIDNGRYQFGAISINEILSDIDIRTTYTREDIVYSVFQLIQDGYIVDRGGDTYNKHHFAFNIGEILFITPKGHTFLSGIKDQKNWGKVKHILEKVGSISLSAIEAVANGVTTAMVGKYIRSIEP